MSGTEQIDIGTVEDSTFRPHLNSEFSIRSKPDVVDGEEAPEEQIIPLTLVEISHYPDHRDEDERFNQNRQPFSLVFKCDLGVLNQACYRFEHAELPPFDLFVTPIEGGEDWCKLEAVIN